MKRSYHPMAIAAAAVLVSFSASAQQRVEEPQQAPRSPWRDSLAYDEYLGGRALRASELIGATVQNEHGENLGEVRDLIVSRADDVVEAVIAVGGVLGIGAKQIGVPYERLRISSDGETLFLAMTREQLEAQPAIDSASVDRPAGRSASSGAAAAAAAAQVQSQRRPAQTREQAVQQQSAVEVMDRGDHRAIDLIGTLVVDSEGEQVGEIDDLVVSPTDGTVQAVLAVGGVLGIGERLVALPLDELDIEPQPADGAASDGERTVRIRMTSEQLLESRPQFQYEDEERTAGVR